MTDINKTIEDLGRSFEEFKSTHTQELNALKAGNSTADFQAKHDKINADIDRLQKEVEDAHTKIAAAQMGASGKPGIKDPEYTASFNAHMRKGDVNAALNKGQAAEGGYLTPNEWDRTILDRLVVISPMRQLASSITISGNGFTKYFNNRGTTSGWVGEAAARPETNGPTLGALKYETGEIYANPAATQQILDDAEIDIENWLASEVETEFAYQEGAAFVSGSGVNKPSGVLTYVTGGTNATAHPWGDIKTVSSGAAAAITSDGLLDLIYALPTEYSSSATLVANRTTLGAIRKLKDGQGNYLWQPSYQAGQPATLSGHQIRELPGLPDIAANSTPVLFGDFKRGYLIVDRIGIRVLRDPFTNKPFVHFYSTKRVGGGLLNPDVIKALKVAA